MVIKVAFKNSSQGSERLKKLVDFTFDLLRQCSSKAQKDVARHCCTSLGALGWIVKDELVLVKKIADWLLDTVESFVGYPEVVHEGLVALVELCKERMEIFGIDVSRHEPGQDGQEDTIAHHLRDKALGLAYTCEARSDFSDDTLNQVYKLLAHTHPLEEVVRFIVANAQAGKNRSWKGMLWSVLDEINDSLSPHITSWTKVQDAGQPRRRTTFPYACRSQPFGMCQISDWCLVWNCSVSKAFATQTSSSISSAKAS
ncbi:unnamed protein product [Polarella glacialis]|uniref:Uncharacterized protein n=1 Tax=Polarella glacialis TaxID=89957 RepID=A0A813DVX8_POLGL|nr:unnamed protein product [Polarella glacialis]